MSDEKVELVRRNYAALERAFDAYWRDPRSIAASMEADDLWPEWEEAFGYLHPEAEWETGFLRASFQGHLEIARAWDDFLKSGENYRVTLQDVEDLGGEQVLAVVIVTGTGRSSGARMDARVYSVATIQDGRIMRLEEYATRNEALEAAQLQG